ncbi:hypothetical protein, partial [Bacillus sp. MB2021]
LNSNRIWIKGSLKDFGVIHFACRKDMHFIWRCGHDSLLWLSQILFEISGFLAKESMPAEAPSKVTKCLNYFQ